MKEIIQAIKDSSHDRIEGSKTYRTLSNEACRSIAKTFHKRPREISILSLENHIIPLKYIKNMGTIGAEGQVKLLRSCISVIGAGGIGGYASVLLARTGVGRIIIVDKDTFDETNLNRQYFSDETVLGEEKARVAVDCLSRINTDVEVEAVQTEADEKNLARILKGTDVAIDALDTLRDRLILEEACRRVGVVLIHGAIAGTTLEVTSIFPGEPGLSSFIPLQSNITNTTEQRGEKLEGIEVETGTPATTPAVAAAFQVQEAIKALTGVGEPLRGRMLYMDIENWSFEIIT
ncbi:MAG: ThiF family adenylyltransferase [Actinomycetota bacterium]|nr:ThiF family adenylyltransferase [Actinomycetota bacterium]